MIQNSCRSSSHYNCISGQQLKEKFEEGPLPFKDTFWKSQPFYLHLAKIYFHGHSHSRRS